MYKLLKISDMKILIYIVVFPFLFISCHGNRKTVKSKSENSEYINDNTKKQNEAKFSPYTKIFLSKLHKEKSEKKEFKPSNELIEEYSLLLIDNKYYVGGLLKVQDSINENELLMNGVKIGTKVKGIWTAKIPILKLEELKLIKEINYIQIDHPVKPKY